MISLETLVMLAALSGANQTVLLDFSAPWCGPCQTMRPTVQRLAAAGYPVRKVDIDRSPRLAAQYGVRAVPCFVMLAGGREVDRVVGPASYARLQRMFKLAEAKSPPRGGSQARGQSPDDRSGSVHLTAARSAARDDPMGRAKAASVRLKIDDASGHSYGSGTIIDAHQEEALVLTCGHIFRDSAGKGRITVDLFMPDGRRSVAGHLIGYDIKRDVGLVSIRPGVKVVPVKVAPAGYRTRLSAPVWSIGCDRGSEPSVRASRITAVDKYLGPPNVEVAGEPVNGRSGGGLFSADGLLIGVCNAADRVNDEGLYAALDTIHAELDRAKLSVIYQPAPSHTAGQELAAAPAPGTGGPVAATDLGDPRSEPANDPSGDRAKSLAGLHATAVRESSQPAERERRGAREDRQGNLEDPEIICIIRPRGGPDAKSRVIVLDRPSSAFLDQLNRESRRQNNRHATSLRVENSWRAVPRATR